MFDGVLDFPERLVSQIKRRCPREQFIHQNTQRVDVAASIDVFIAHLSLFRTHVCGGTDHITVIGEQCFFGQALIDGLCDSEVNDFRQGHAVMRRDHDV